ncbi:unknown [Bacteroides sp. CAG:545]|nr:unknown [Bacteroides sp. CAG:545]
MPGRSWRAGKASGDGKPAGPDRPLEKGDGGIEIVGTESQYNNRKRVRVAEGGCLENS